MKSQSVTAPSLTKKRYTFFTDVRRNRFSYLLILPALLYVLVFSYLSYPYMIIAFKNFNYKLGVFGSEWCGFKNFEFFLKSTNAPTVIRNTLVLNILFIVTGTLTSLVLAILLNELRSRVFVRTAQTMMLFPHYISWVVVSYFVFAFLNTDYGTLNRVIMFFGGEPHRWYSEATYWPLFFVILKVWKGTGYGMVVYLATITGIDGSLYEAAMLDGASKWQQTRYITMPMLKTVIVMMFILSVGGIFASDFGLFYQVTQGVPNSLYKVASTFDTYVYAALQGNAPIGKTAAASTFQSVACCITILLTNFIVSKVDSDSAVF